MYRFFTLIFLTAFLLFGFNQKGFSQTCDCPAGLTSSQTFNTVDVNNTTVFTVPLRVTSVSIQAVGGDGGDGQSLNGGTGACFTGTFPVTPNDELLIVVGAKGTTTTNGGGGGGGGTAVINKTTSTLLIVAGAGGGGRDNFDGIGGKVTDNTNLVDGAGGSAGSDAGGGGGFNMDGVDDNKGAGGKKGTLLGGDLGGSGLSLTNASGGFGFGGGGEGSQSSDESSGGGGGFIGGAGGGNGGDSFRASIGTLIGSLVGVDGGTNNMPQDGSVKVCWNEAPAANLSFDSNNEKTFGDPCSCTDAKNCDVNGVTYFHDTLDITAVGAFATGLDIRITSATNFFTSVPCVGGGLIVAPANTQVIETPANSGIYKIEFWRASGVVPTLTVTEGGTASTAPASTFQPVCLQEDCITIASDPIPTMSQWGLLIFGLLMLNLGVIVLYKLKKIQ